MTSNERELVERLRRKTRPSAMKDRRLVNPDGPEAADALELLSTHAAKLEGEVERMRAKYEGPSAGTWFYPEGDTSSDACCMGPYEVLDEHYFYDDGVRSGVFPIERAVALPPVYVAVRAYTEAEKDERESDDEYTVTFHTTEEEARTALEGKESDNAE